MIYKIENEFLTCEIKSMGAELHSLKSKDNGKEYIWYGREEIWYGQAPILFPVIGQLNSDRYFYEGKAYSLPKHGFARKLEFNMNTLLPLIKIPAPTLFAKFSSNVEFIINASFPMINNAPPSVSLALFPLNVELTTFTIFPFI